MIFIKPPKQIVDFSGTYVDYVPPQYSTVNIGKRFVNPPININLVRTFRKVDIKETRLEKLIYYKIEFVFSDFSEFWVFETEEQRDAEYLKIIEMFSFGNEKEIQ